MKLLLYASLPMLGCISATAFAQSGAPFTLLDHKAVKLNAPLAEGDSGKAAGKISKDKKSLEFAGPDINLVVHTGPEEDMLSFRVQGLRNPNLIVHPGATLHITFVNTDEDMFHDMRFGAMRSSFEKTPDVTGTVGSVQLAHSSEDVMNADVMTIKAPSKPGKYAYFCSVKGHALGGMRGTILVR